MNQILPLSSEMLPTSKRATTNPTDTPQLNTHGQSFDVLNNALSKLFPENNVEEREIIKMKELLGAKGKGLTTDQIQDLMIKIKYLVNSWIDDFEKEIYDGMTLNQLLASKKNSHYGS